MLVRNSKSRIDSDLVNQVKKAAKIRGVSMSDYIRDRLESGFRTNKPESISMFKYFGIGS